MRQHPCPLRAEFARNSVTPDQAALDAQYFLVELGDLTFRLRDRNNRAGIASVAERSAGKSIESAAYALDDCRAPAGSGAGKGRIDLVLRRNRLRACCAAAAALVADAPRSQRFESAIAARRLTGHSRDSVSGAKPDDAALCARSAGAEQSAQRMRALSIDFPALRSATDAYAGAIISIAETEGQIAKLDRKLLGIEGRLIGRVTELLAQLSRATGTGVVA